MSDKFKLLAKQLTTQPAKMNHEGQELVEVSVPVSTAAAIYERVRNTLDYQEEHLLRRNAILRIVKRYLSESENLHDVGPDLIKELVWAKYFPGQEIPMQLGEDLNPILSKYTPLFKAADGMGERREAVYQWILDVLATEIEYTVAPNQGEEALVAYMYDEIKQRSDWDPGLKITEEQRDLTLFIAVHKALVKSNHAILRYRVLTLYYPKWVGAADEKLVEQLALHLGEIYLAVERQIFSPLTDRVSKLLRRKAGIFRVLGEALITLQKTESGSKAKGNNGEKKSGVDWADPEVIDSAVAQSLALRTKEFRVRLRRTVVRTVLFMFLTKMILAILFELPYDLLLHQGEIILYPLGINILFPPLLLALIGLTVGVPEKKNTQVYQEVVRALAVKADHAALHLRIRTNHRSSLKKVFDAIYGVLFVAIYAGIAIGLHLANFNVVSIAFFLFFLSLVTFFGIRIRYSVKDIVAKDVRSGLFGTIFDILLIPIVRAGSWLSAKVSKINIFIYFFDFIIEAPLKVAIEFIEGWIAFVRNKKEEI